jgi:hypothetical protein
MNIQKIGFTANYFCKRRTAIGISNTKLLMTVSHHERACVF